MNPTGEGQGTKDLSTIYSGGERLLICWIGWLNGATSVFAGSVTRLMA